MGDAAKIERRGNPNEHGDGRKSRGRVYSLMSTF